MENNLEYEEINMYSLDTLHQCLKNDNLKNIATAMVGFVLGEKDWKKAENVILECMDDERLPVREIAITCIGHIARIHGKIDKKIVKEKFDLMKNEDKLHGKIEDALDDIDIFVKQR